MGECSRASQPFECTTTASGAGETASADCSATSGAGETASADRSATSRAGETAREDPSPAQQLDRLFGQVTPSVVSLCWQYRVGSLGR
jgi:hypothetical protein